MSGELAVRAAILAALQDDLPLAGLVNQVSDGEPVKASAPWLLVGDAITTGWGARGVDGLTLHQPIQLVLRGDDLARVMAILERVDTVLAAIDGDLGEWRITSLRFERSRIVRGRTEWRAGIDYAVRAARIA
jgi:hypothetical protein